MDFACQGCSLWHFPLAGLHFWGNQTSCFNNGGCEAAYLRTAFRVIRKHIETEHFPLAARPYIPAGSWTTSKCWLPTPTVRNGIMNMKIPKCSSRNSENCEVADTNKAQRMELCKMPGGLASRRARYLGTLNLRTNTPGYRMYQSTNQKLKVSYPSYPRASVREPDPNISWFTCGQRCGVMSSECLCTSPMPTFIRYKNSKMFISCIGLRHHAKMMVYDAKCTHSLRTKSEILLHPLAWYCAQTWATTKTATQLNAISTTPCLPGHHCVPSSLSMFKAWILGICLQVPHWHLGSSCYAGSDWNNAIHPRANFLQRQRKKQLATLPTSKFKPCQKHPKTWRWLEGIDRLTSQGKINYLFVPRLIVSQAREVSTLEPSPRGSISSTEGWTLKLIGVTRLNCVDFNLCEIQWNWLFFANSCIQRACKLEGQAVTMARTHPQTGPSGPSVDGGQCRWFFIDLQLLLMLPFGAPDSCPGGSGDVNPPGVRVEGGAGAPPNHDIICFAMVCGWTPGAAPGPPRSGSGGSWDVLKPGLVRCSWRRGGPGKSLESASEKQVRNQAFLISGGLNSKEFTQ